MKKFMKGLIAAGLTFAMITPVFAEDPSPVKVGSVIEIQIGDKPAPTGTTVVKMKMLMLLSKMKQQTIRHLMKLRMQLIQANP